MDIDNIREQLMSKTAAKADLDPRSLLSTGNTLLNLACTGHREGGFEKGTYVNLTGDSQSGKTFYTLTCFAEACSNESFDDYELIFNDVEDGSKMNFEYFFGKRMAERIEPVCIPFIEDFYYDLHDRLVPAKKGGEQPPKFIYVCDSADSLKSKYGDKKFQEGKAAAAKGKEGKGDYGDGKAKIHSENIRRLIPLLAATGSILIIISQTRDNIDGGMFDAKKTRAGGHALKFYATTEIWTSVSSAEKRSHKDNDIKVGSITTATVKKNRHNGRERAVQIPIYYDYGFDDIGGMINFLIKWKYWKGGTKIDTRGFVDEPMPRKALIAHIEENEMEVELQIATEKAWHEIEAAVASNRKSKYE